MKHNQLEILVTDRESIEKGFLVRTPYVLISIRDPDKSRVRIPRSPLLRACLELGFHDSEPTANFKLPDNIRLISEEDTEKIWTFILGLQEEVKTVVVHCEQGMSRSPAVAAAICGCLGGDPSIFLNTYQPNQFVFKAVREAYRRSKGG